MTLDIKRELRILEAMVSHLTPYLYEDELFGHIDSQLPKLTIGGLLMRLHRLEGLDLPGDQRAQVEEARQHFEATRYEWLTHYKAKLEQEINARINSIRWYLDDCVSEPATCDGGWPNEAEKRTMLAHLQTEADAQKTLTTTLRSKIADLDARMRRHCRQEEFFWDEALQVAYPREEFWWLYCRPGRE